MISQFILCVKCTDDYFLFHLQMYCFVLYMLLFSFIESLFGVLPIRRNLFRRILKKYSCFVEKIVLRIFNYIFSRNFLLL